MPKILQKIAGGGKLVIFLPQIHCLWITYMIAPVSVFRHGCFEVIMTSKYRKLLLIKGTEQLRLEFICPFFDVVFVKHHTIAHHDHGSAIDFTFFYGKFSHITCIHYITNCACDFSVTESF